ncbi:unnamed protein product [Urochloa decumbens]|uniref:KIB1-4 beta-propeller domain-containing protein n=1 Tax=Urochloa decumbens TaxID=240449 RepID=A0ABC9GXD4_9POAL
MMPDAAAAEASRWSDLPFDLLRDISCRLHAAGDYVRFHAVCEHWHDTLPPAANRPFFLPWLLSRRDNAAGGGHRTARCVSSMMPTICRRRSFCPTMAIPDENWVTRFDDGTAAWILTTRADSSVALINAATGGSPAIPIPADDINNWVHRATGAVCGDGTILLYAFGHVVCSGRYCLSYNCNFDMALLHPGDTTWTMVRIPEILDISPNNRDRCCVAYYRRKIVACLDNSWCVATVLEASEADSGDDWWNRKPCDAPGFESSYVVESRGELLWVFVHVKCTYNNGYHSYHYRSGVVSPLATLLSVLVYTLQEEEDGGGELEWVRKDSHSLCDRVLFLGRPRSFAVDATRVGMADAGCAYFVLNEWCRVYNFCDGKSELVEQLPADWSDKDCMWLTPKPSIATTQEIRERLGECSGKASEPQRRYGPYFRIYVGNLPRKVDHYRLRQFFSKHGMCLDGRPLRVSFADQEKRSTAGKCN